MIDVQLYIEGNRVDFFDDETIQIKSSIQDIKDAGRIFTDFTQSFDIPANATNNDIFKHFYNYDITTGYYDARKKKEAEIHLNYAPFKLGRVYLNGVKMRDNKPFAYSIVFYGNLVSMKDLIGEDELSDLDYLQNYKHDYSFSNVKSGLTDGLDFTVNSVSQEEAVIYPLITSKKRLFYDSNASIPYQDNMDGNLYHDTSSPDGKRGLRYTDVKPAIKCIHLIEAIEDKYGIEFTRDFFDNTEFSNLYLWLSRNKGEINEYEEETSTVLNGFVIDSTHNNVTELTQSNGVFTLVTDGTSSDTFEISMSVNPDDYNNEDNYTLKRIDTSDDSVEATETAEGGITMTHTINNNVAATHTFKYEVSSDTIITYSATLICIKEDAGDVQVSREQHKIASDSNLDEIIIEDQVPKLKVMDFLTGLFKMFNLTAYYIDDRGDADFGKIKVDTLDEFYADAVNNPSGGTIDVQDYIDTSQHQVNVSLPFTEIHFKYQDPSTLLMEQHLERNGVVFGDNEYEPSDVERGNKYEIQLPFEHMKFERIVDGLDKINTEIHWGYSAAGEFNFEEGVQASSKPSTGNYEAVLTKPVVFYGVQKTGITETINLIEGNAGTSIDKYFRPSNTNEDGTDSVAPSFTLNFDNEVDEYQQKDYGGETNSLFKKFYKTYIEAVFNPLKRIHIFTAYLPQSFLINYRLNDQLKVQDRVFRINSITTDVNTGKSTLELINLFSDEIV